MKPVIFKIENKDYLELTAKELGMTVSQLMRKITNEFLEARTTLKKNSYNSSHLFVGFDNLSEKELKKTIDDLNHNKINDDRNLNFEL